MFDPRNDPSGDAIAAMAFAHTLAKDYAAKGGSVTDLLAAFVGVIVDRDGPAGREALSALDQYVTGLSRDRRS